MVWYSYLFKNFSQFVVIYSVKVFSIVSEGEVDFFFLIPLFFYDPMDSVNLSLIPLPFLNPACIYDSSWSYTVEI